MIKHLCMTVLAVMLAGSTALSHAQEATIDKAAADAFDAKIFTEPPGKKAYACFVRHYDADHLARHPKQKVSAMQLLVTAEIQPEEKTMSYSFRLGVKYRHRPGDFDCSGYCNLILAEDAGKEIRFGCGVDCEGGGINVALSKDDKSAIVRLDRITIWQRNKPDDEAGDAACRRRRQDLPARSHRQPRLRGAGDRPQGTRRDQTQVIGL